MVLDLSSLLSGKSSRLDFEYEITQEDEENAVLPRMTFLLQRLYV